MIYHFVFIFLIRNYIQNVSIKSAEKRNIWSYFTPQLVGGNGLEIVLKLELSRLAKTYSIFMKKIFVTEKFDGDANQDNDNRVESGYT